MRTKITLECTECKQRNYNTTNDKKTHPDRVETKKYCKFCQKHTCLLYTSPRDVLVLCSEPIEPMSLVRCYPIGVMYMIDGDDMDDKIIAIPYGDPTYNCYTDIKQLP